VDVSTCIRIKNTKNGLKIRVRGTVSLAGNRVGRGGFAASKTRWEIGLLVEKCTVRAPVHMNGRVYDPELGRFLSADPFVQSEGDLQNYNRYSYVLNNPLSYTDPSGHFISLLAGLFFKFGLEWTGVQLWLGVAAAAATEVVLAGGSFIDAVTAFGVSFISAGITSEIGTIFNDLGDPSFWGELGRAAAHGAVQGAFTELQGGDFSAGFASAFVSSSAGSLMGLESASEFFEDEVVSTLSAAVVGGTTSELSGGSFANGAVTGAFVQMFNHLHARSPQDQAAYNALEEANALSIKENVEYGGLIYKNEDGSYGYTTPRTDNHPTTVDVDAAMDLVPDKATVVGRYHTHGDWSFRNPDTLEVTRVASMADDNLNSNIWSRSDFHVAETMAYAAELKGIKGYRSYLGTPSGTYRVYAPRAEDPASRYYNIKEGNRY